MIFTVSCPALILLKWPFRPTINLVSGISKNVIWKGARFTKVVVQRGNIWRLTSPQSSLLAPIPTVLGGLDPALLEATQDWQGLALWQATQKMGTQEWLSLQRQSTPHADGNHSMFLFISAQWILMSMWSQALGSVTGVCVPFPTFPGAYSLTSPSEACQWEKPQHVFPPRPFSYFGSWTWAKGHL